MFFLLTVSHVSRIFKLMSALLPPVHESFSSTIRTWSKLPSQRGYSKNWISFPFFSLEFSDSSVISHHRGKLRIITKECDLSFWDHHVRSTGIPWKQANRYTLSSRPSAGLLPCHLASCVRGFALSPVLVSWKTSELLFSLKHSEAVVERVKEVNCN